MKEERVLKVPEGWFLRLLEIAEKTDLEHDKWYPFLRGYLDSAKTIVKYNKEG